jgi:hypothetical protein
MSSNQDADSTVEALDFFSLPAALADLNTDHLICWNKSFAESLNVDVEELKLLKVSSAVTMAWVPEAFKQAKLEPIDYASCSIKLPLSDELQFGRAFRRADHFVLIILDADARVTATDEFLRGVALGKHEEKERIRKQFHDFISHQILLVAFEAHNLTSRLRKEGANGDPELGRMVQMLDELIADIHIMLSEAPEARKA